MSRRSRQEELRKVARGSEALYGGRGDSKDIWGGGTKVVWRGTFIYNGGKESFLVGMAVFKTPCDFTCSLSVGNGLLW